MQYALNLLESGKVKVKDLISATYPLPFWAAMMMNGTIKIIWSTNSFKERREFERY